MSREPSSYLPNAQIWHWPELLPSTCRVSSECCSSMLSDLRAPLTIAFVAFIVGRREEACDKALLMSYYALPSRNPFSSSMCGSIERTPHLGRRRHAVYEQAFVLHSCAQLTLEMLSGGATSSGLGEKTNGQQEHGLCSQKMLRSLAFLPEIIS